MIWTQFLKPRYYDQGVNAYWLDETDGEGTVGGDGAYAFFHQLGIRRKKSNSCVLVLRRRI